MRAFVYKHWADIVGWGTAIVVFVAIVMLGGLGACNSIKRTSIVGGGAGGGAAVGALVGGPVGAIGGAVVGGAVASAVVESDIAEERTERLEDHLAGRPLPPEPTPLERVPLWGWIAAGWAWLRRAHIADALTGKEPRFDAIMRALGLRTHKTPIPTAVKKR